MRVIMAEFVPKESDAEFTSLPANLPKLPPTSQITLDETTCGICMQGISKPRILPCSHSFCQQCLIEKVCTGNDIKTVVCSVCEKSFPMPGNGISAFPTRRPKRRSSTKRSQYQRYSSQRGKELCQIHNLSGSLMSKDYYCYTCEKPICRDCAAQTSMCGNHETVYLKEAATKQKALLEEQVRVLRRKQEEVHDAISEINTFHRGYAVIAKAKEEQLSRGKDQNMNKFTEAAAKEKEQEKEMAKKLTQTTTDLFAKEMQLQQAIEELLRTKESTDDHLVSTKFADLARNVETLSQFHPKEITQEEKAELDMIGNAADLPCDEGSYHFPGVDTLRLIIIGLTGAGKSSTGNNILAPAYLSKEAPKYGNNGKWGMIRPPFKTSACPSSVTSKCEMKKAHIQGRVVSIIDTPGFYDTKKSHESTLHEIINCMYLSHPGPHAILLVIQLGRHTDSILRAVELMRKMFGEDSLKFIMIVFTEADKLASTGETIEDVVSNMQHSVQDLLESCEHRYVPFNNTVKPLSEENREQVEALLELAEEIAESNEGECFKDTLATRLGEMIEDTLQKSKERIKTLSMEKQLLQKELQEAKKKLEEGQDHLEAEKTELKEQIDDLEKQIEEKEKTICDLKRKSEQPHAMLVEESIERDLEKRLQHAEFEVTNLKTQVALKNMTIEHHKRELDQLKLEKRCHWRAPEPPKVNEVNVNGDPEILYGEDEEQQSHEEEEEEEEESGSFFKCILL